jgi:DHA3 family tetracycline resistance protein-like MFS transporter
MLTKRTAYPVYLWMETITSLASWLVFTVDLIYQVTIVGLNPLQLVLVGTTVEVTAFIFEVPTGVVADTISRKVSIIAGLILIGVGFIIEGAIPRFETILVAQVVAGIGYTFTSGATEAWIADEVGETKATRAFMRGSQLSYVGALLGTVGAVALGSVAINLPIIIGGAIMILVGLALIVIMPETGFKPTPRENRTTFQSMLHTFKSGVKLVRGKPVLISILLLGLIYGAYSEGFDRLWTAHFLQDIVLPTFGTLQPVVWFGIIRVVSLLLSIGLTEFATRKVNTDSHGLVARAVLALNVSMVIGLLTFAVTGNFVIALLAYWLTSSARRTLNPVYTAWVNQHLESSVRATVISMTSQIDALGQIIGGPIIGVIGTAFGVPFALVGSGLILSIALPLLVRTIRIDQQRLAAIVEPVAIE